MSILFIPPPLRDYQIDLLGRVRQRHAQGARRVLTQAATGSGKTHIIAEVARCACEKGSRVLILAHRRRLISQIGERLDWFGVPHGVIMQGHPVTPGPIQVASRDTLLARGVRDNRIELPPADLLIVDEAHNGLADQYLALLEAYGGSWMQGYTATPARSDGKGLGKFWQALECAVPTSVLVAGGYLVPTRCYAPESLQGKHAKQTKGLAGDPVEHWKRYAEGRPTVLFANTIAASLGVRNAFLAAGVQAEHIDANTPDDQRESVIARLKAGEIKVVCNVGVWTEGVDIPELSCCILLRLAGSYTFYAQTVGRIMRAHPGKKDAVLIDHAGAVFRHGFPDEDVEWTLDEEDTVDARVKKAKDEGKRREPVLCPRCALLFSGTAICPSCGYILQPKTKVELRRDELLTEVERTRGKSVDRETRERFWLKCLGIMANKRRSCGAAAHMYRDKFGEWPPDDFRHVPHGTDWKRTVGEVYPQFLQRAFS